MKIKLLLLFIILFQLSFAQEKRIHGKIAANGNNVEGINIVNLVNEKSAVSDANGNFYILAKAEDLLVLSAINFEYKRKIISEDDLKLKIIEIEMVPKVGQIDEVVITKYQNINAVDLGILSKPAKKYTPEERKLKTAGDFKPIHLLSLLGGSFQFDPILNAINGKTKRLKKEISIEKREKLLSDLEDLLAPEYFVETLKIDVEKVKGFQYFSIEDEQIEDLIVSKNKTFLSLRLIQLAEEYKELQADEK